MRARVELRRREVVADVEALGGDDEAVERAEGELEVRRLALADDQAGEGDDVGRLGGAAGAGREQDARRGGGLEEVAAVHGRLRLSKPLAAMQAESRIAASGSRQNPFPFVAV